MTLPSDKTWVVMREFSSLMWHVPHSDSLVDTPHETGGIGAMITLPGANGNNSMCLYCGHSCRLQSLRAYTSFISSHHPPSSTVVNFDMTSVLMNCKDCSIRDSTMITEQHFHLDSGAAFFLQLTKRFAPGASYDSQNRDVASPAGIEAAALQSVSIWMSNEGSRPILCINGHSRTLNSTIARIIAEEWAKRQELGASFFFNSNRLKCDSIHYFATTIAFQLAQSLPDFHSRLVKSMHDDSLILDRSISIQVEKLISEPLRSLTTRDPFLIIIDALEDCAGKEDQRKVLAHISGLVRAHPGLLRFIVVGLPTSHSRCLFNHPDFCSLSTSFLLREMGQSMFTRNHPGDNHLTTYHFISTVTVLPRILLSMSEETKGASNNERLLAAARSDNEDLILDIFEQGGFDINCVDGLGNTPLHNAVSHGSTDVLEHILSCEGCDVDPVNRMEGATPLHFAVRIEHIALRKHIVESLLEAGADTRIKDKNGEEAVDLLPLEEKEIRGLIRKARALESVSKDDIADDDDGEPGSGSEE
ncbi:hypothetical protein E4T56_gene14523 [Termitomyces sp. T112]|nr:hypothetical protein E4T56_gene14523 [Termitomyces sp. T112]